MRKPLRHDRQLISLNRFAESFNCNHQFKKHDDGLICHICKWVKYQIEIDAEIELELKLFKREIKPINLHIDLFNIH